MHPSRIKLFMVFIFTLCATAILLLISHSHAGSQEIEYQLPETEYQPPEVGNQLPEVGKHAPDVGNQLMSPENEENGHQIGQNIIENTYQRTQNKQLNTRNGHRRTQNMQRNIRRGFKGTENEQNYIEKHQQRTEKNNLITEYSQQNTGNGDQRTANNQNNTENNHQKIGSKTIIQRSTEKWNQKTQNRPQNDKEKQTKNSSMQIRARKRKANTNGVNHVSIVEEHHEALFYWMKAAKEGLLPKSGNTLLHFDAHVDLMGPIWRHAADFPLFRWPQNVAEERQLYQMNDNFIQVAGSIGLINRFIWVIPDWAKSKEDKHTEKRSDFLFRGTFGIGLTEVQGKFSKFTAFCACERRTESKKTDCSHDTQFSSSESATISRDKCKIQRIFKYEYMTLQQAKKLIHRKSWLSNTSLILDVDEDFWGCEGANKMMKLSKLPVKVVDEIDTLLSKTFCLKQTKQENYVNIFLKTIIKIKQEKTAREWHGRRDWRRWSRDQFDKLVLTEMEQNYLLTSDMFCQTRQEWIDLRLSQLVRLLSELDGPQLEGLGRIGVCLITSDTSVFEEDRKLKICHGVNMPNRLVSVPFHAPSNAEIDEVAHEFSEILLHRNFPEVLVTSVCRSVRDGYTPRLQNTRIEQLVLSILRARPADGDHDDRWLDGQPDRQRITVTYDKNLLGGRKGWSHYSNQKPLPP